MPWVETASPAFTARHDAAELDDVVALLELLERTREALAGALPVRPEGIGVVVHSSPAQLDVAQPPLVLARRRAHPAARRYIAGWCTASEIHVLAPRLLAARASGAPGSREMLELVPATLYCRVAIGASNRRLPPPHRPRRLLRARRWAWLHTGAASWLSGQAEHARPAIARRLHEGPKPAFPPAAADALLLGPTLVDPLAREEGERALLSLLLDPRPGRPRQALERAFGGRALRATEGTWRAQLARIARGHG
ncbi:MAG TPA: hypothetical protein VFT42_00775 [Solirubrobacteraceae bacterium]|nr:hypothetical protein [Solirubrobacteraceae bacterium]